MKGDFVIVMKERSQIEEKYKWDLSKYCKNDDDYYNLLSSLEEDCNRFTKFEGKLSNDKILKEYLDLKTQIGEKLEKRVMLFFVSVKIGQNARQMI